MKALIKDVAAIFTAVFGETGPRAAAAMIWMDAHMKQSGAAGEDKYGWWGGANAREAALLDVNPQNNPGDHSKLAQRSREQLREDLKTLRGLPDTKWKAGRIEATLAELETRRRLQ